MRCPAIVTIIDFDENEFKCKGTYFGVGRITCVHDGVKLVVDPECYYRKDAKRMFSVDGLTDFRVKSVLLDSKAILKNS